MLKRPCMCVWSVCEQVSVPNSWRIISWSRALPENPPVVQLHFMEPEGLLPSTDPYPKPDQSSP
jgi:hypothetical protein